MEGEKKGNTDIAYLPIDLLVNATDFFWTVWGGGGLTA